MQIMNQPAPDNGYLAAHAEVLISNYHRCTGRDLVDPELSAQARYRALFEAPYGVVSHNSEADPIFNYGNQTALSVFERDWFEFTKLASRKSAEPVNRVARERLLARVTQHGFVDDYQGVRISATGKRFRIEDATVWNLVDRNGLYCGQAAVFRRINFDVLS
tara:strand:+ start:39627 stop:40112 length:486 start_codon:yes stop_codon:yes gene_type:complete